MRVFKLSLTKYYVNFCIILINLNRIVTKIMFFKFALDLKYFHKIEFYWTLHIELDWEEVNILQ